MDANSTKVYENNVKITVETIIDGKHEVKSIHLGKSAADFKAENIGELITRELGSTVIKWLKK
jgi:hypothetical protein